MTMRAALIAVMALLLAAAPGAAGRGAAAPGSSPHASQTGAEVDPGILDGSKQRRLDAARRSWKAVGVRSYSYVVRLSCFCPPRPGTRMVVRNGTPASGTPAGMREVATVPRLFRTIQRAIDRKVAAIDVRYGRRGVPSSISIDQSGMIADEESYYTISRFTVLRQRSG